VQPKVVMFFGFYNEETMKVASFNKWQKELYEIVASTNIPNTTMRYCPIK
jgi:hypothetical protein